MNINSKAKNKLDIYSFFCNKTHIEYDNDPLPLLINNIKEVNTIYKNYPYESKKLFYFMRKNIHKLFYNEDYVFELNKKDLSNNDSIDLSTLFYLSLLLMDEPEIINYKYDFYYIKEIHNKIFKNYKEGSLRNFVAAKIILNLIKYFENEDDECEDALNELEQDNRDIIEKCIEENDIVKNLKLDIDVILEKPIDEIYTKIIQILIENNYFSDYSQIINILEELNIESINITNFMYQGLIKVLDENNCKLNKYKIVEEKDLIEEKVNFFFILMKYIFRINDYIYKIPLLKQNCLNIIKFKESLNPDEEKTLYDKAEYISSYFPNLSKEEGGSSINYKYKEGQSLNSGFVLSESGSESKENLSVLNKSILSDCKKEDYGSNFRLAEKICKGIKIKLVHDYFEIGNSIYKIKEIYLLEDKFQENIIYNYSDELSGEQFLNSILANIEKGQKKYIYKNFLLLINFLKKVTTYISENELYYKPDINLELTNETSKTYFSLEDEINISEQVKNIYNFTCISSFKNENSKEISFVDYNVLANGIDEEPYGFINLINELTNEDYKKETE